MSIIFIAVEIKESRGFIKIKIWNIFQELISDDPSLE